MVAPSSFTLGNVPIGGGKLFLIAGPCVLESEPHARMLADAIQRIAADLAIPYIFKASYDKANRTSIHSFRGPGLTEGCRILRAIGEQNKLPVLTDVHTPEQCAEVSDALGPVAAMLQIPAFLCRQTDLLIAAAHAAKSANRAVNVKKGQFVAPADMRHAVVKLNESGCPRAAVAAGIDGIFLEVHDNPAEAKSDGANALRLDRLKPLLETLLEIHKAVSKEQ